MPTIQTNGVEMYYERTGSGEPLLLVPGLLFSGESWRQQVDAFSTEFECFTVDLRGQHRTETTEDPAGYEMWNQMEDVYGLIRELGIGPVHYAGLSMGGFIGMRMAIRHPEALRDLMLLDTTSLPEQPENIERYEAFRQITAAGQLEAVLPALPVTFFCDEYIRDQKAQVDAWLESLTRGNPLGFVRASRAVDERLDITDQLSRVSTPTLVLHGTEDVAIPLERGEALAEAIPGAWFVPIDGAGHQSNMDHPGEVTHLMGQFLAEVRAAAPAAPGS